MGDKVDDFMNENRLKKVPGFNLKEVGDSILGTITGRDVADLPKLGSKTGETDRKLILQLKTDKEYTQPGKDKDKNPIMITSDEWALFIGKSQLLGALNKALAEADAPVGSPRIGDRIAVKLVGFEPTDLSPKKIHEVTYKVVSAPVTHTTESLLAAPSGDDLL